MSETLEALVLGIVQGITEFLPVSSSGHLEIVKYLMGDDSLAEQSMMTTVFLHFATAISTIIVFRKDILSILKGILKPQGQEERKFSFYIILSMIPAVIVGLFFDEFIEAFFHQKIILVSIMLLVTGLLLYLSERMSFQNAKLGYKSAFIVGLGQAVAILPGLSRSGTTIATSLMLGLNKREATRFSFLMVIPLIFGKIAKDLLSGEFVDSAPSFGYLAVGFVAALITGILACTAMIQLVQKSRLSWFALYCVVVGLGMITYKLVN